MATTIERHVQVNFAGTVTVDPVTNRHHLAYAGALAPKPETTQRRFTLWFDPSEFAAKDDVALKIEAHRRLMKLAERDAGKRLDRSQVDLHVEKLRESLIEVAVERDENGKVVSTTPVRGRR